MTASLAICILAALLPVGACLQCEVCQGSGNKCTGTLESCPAQDFCGFALSEATMEKSETQSIVKGCAKSTQCKTGPISANLGKGLTVRTNIACCVEDACKTITVTVPPADTKPNGLRCRGCYDLSSGQCRENTIDCTGAETQCVAVTWNLTAEQMRSSGDGQLLWLPAILRPQAARSGGPANKFILKGCSTMSFCDQVKAGFGSITRIQAELMKVKCRAASTVASTAAGPASLFLPALAGLLLVLLQLLSWFPSQ